LGGQNPKIFRRYAPKYFLTPHYLLQVEPLVEYSRTACSPGSSGH